MANGPLGGNMGTPPVPPQPPQVNFETTAQSRGNFNNFLKSMPNTTSMTPIPPMGSSPMMPAPNPMANIDIFNQPPSMGMGMMGMNQPPMNPMMQQPMQQPMNMGVGLMGTPVQNFYNGGYADSDFGGFSDYGSVDNTDFSDPDSDMDYTDSYTDQDFTDATNIGSGGDNQPGAFPTSRPEILKEAIARAENEIFGGTASDDLGFINKDGSLTDAGQKEYDSSIMANLDVLQDERPADTGTQLASIFDNKDILTASTKNVNPADIVQASFRPSSLNSTFSNDVLDGLDLNTAFGGNRGAKTDTGVIGSTDAELNALERSIANTQRANEIQNQLANVNNQTLADRVQNQRGLGIDISTIPDISLENIMSSNISKEDPNKATVTQNISPQNTADRISRNNRTIDDIKADMGSRVPDTVLGTMIDRRDIFQPDDITFDPITIEESRVGDDFDTALTLADRNEADRLAAGQAMGVGTAPNLQNLTSTAMGRGQNVTRSIAPEDFEENVGRPFDAKRMADIERLYGVNTGQAGYGTGPIPNFKDTSKFQGGQDPTFFEGKGFTGTAGGILDAIERKTRENMANEIALGRPMGLGETLFGYNAPDLRTQTMEDYMSNTQKNVLNEAGDSETVSRRLPDNQLIRNDSGRVIGIRDASGRLVSGMDPNAPMGSDDNNENPFVIKPKPEEEKEEEDKPPNVIGGGDPLPVPETVPTVVDSPFTSNVSDFVPSTFNTGDINKLIEMLTGIAAPKSMKKGGVAGYAEGGKVMQALDNLLATA